MRIGGFLILLVSILIVFGLFVSLRSGFEYSRQDSADTNSSPLRSIAEKGITDILQSHPRLYFSSEDLPLLRKRSQTTHRKIFETMVASVSDKETVKKDWTWSLATLGFLYQMTGAKKYCSWAIEIMMDQPKAGRGDYVGVNAFALGYDWCFDLMTPGQKKVIVEKLREASYKRPSVQGLTQNTRAYHPEAIGWVFHYPFAAIFDGVEDEWASAFAEIYREVFLDVQLPAINEAGPDGANSGYATTDALNIAHLAQTWNVLTGDDLFNNSPFLSGQAYYWLYRRLAAANPKGSLSADAGQQMGVSLLGGSEMALFAKNLGNPYAQSVAKRDIESLRLDPRPFKTRGLWKLILWYDPESESRPLEELPTSQIFRGLGEVYMKGAWEKEGAHMTLWSGTSTTHGVPKANGFMLSYGNDGLVVRPGVYMSLMAHGSLFYHTSLGSNSLFINGLQGRKKTRHDKPRIDELKQMYPIAASLKHLGDNFPNPEGEIKRFVDEPEFSYAMGDATPMYRLNGITLFTREIVFLKPDVFVIFDHVKLNRQPADVRFMMHHYVEPEFDGQIQKVRGTQDEGGIYESFDTRTSIVTSGSSKLITQTLLPQEVRYRKIGGKNFYNYNPVLEKNIHPLNYESWVSGDGKLQEPQYVELFTKRYGTSERPTKRELPKSARTWRVEISPMRPSAEIYFLNLLFVGDTSLTAPEVEFFPHEESVEVHIRKGEKSFIVKLSKKAETGSLVLTNKGKKPVEVHFPKEINYRENGRRYSAAP